MNKFDLFSKILYGKECYVFGTQRQNPSVSSLLTFKLENLNNFFQVCVTKPHFCRLFSCPNWLSVVTDYRASAKIQHWRRSVTGRAMWRSVISQATWSLVGQVMWRSVANLCKLFKPIVGYNKWWKHFWNLCRKLFFKDLHFRHLF